ncbi:MAG: adenylate/guanylate cyclase domain-containing protein [Deltaproteobacteria bacterium]|nr:adenylate/guanylate cyclase domain-containing protein [Deltaproteobacteria bacterium]
MNPAVQRCFDWLVDGAPGAPTPADTVARLCPELVAAGIPLHRVEAFVRTLHPHIVGRSFVWTHGSDGVVVRENSYAFLSSPAFLENPVSAVFADGKPARHRLADASARRGELLDGLAREGFTDFYAGPLRFLNGTVHAITFATKAPSGFTDEHVGALDQILRPLSRVAEIFALSRTAVNLLNTYVGRGTGERVMSGKIVRGDMESIRCALWFSDLRDFTGLSARLPPGRIIGVLNELFDCQVPAIEAHGGEVLKFMGDGLLAVFPTGMGPSDREVCDGALLAAREAFAALDARNARADAVPPITFGVALHVGDVAYGNIGGAGRLDFTCIGSAVNLAARLEGLTGKLGRRVVVSAEFAALASGAPVRLGAFELKGVPGQVEAFAPSE